MLNYCNRRIAVLDNLSNICWCHEIFRLLYAELFIYLIKPFSVNQRYKQHDEHKPF